MHSPKKMAENADQLDFFQPPRPLPAGFRYSDNLISEDEELELLREIRELPLTEFAFHGYTGNRRTVSFGWAYDFARESLDPSPEMPSFLLKLRETAAGFADLPPANLQQALIIEYGTGVGIGWHRDKGVFEQVVGVSLLSACRFRLRRPRGRTWERITIEAAPRSAYLLSGPARWEWEHSIPAVEMLRYSVTFRTLRQNARIPAA
jgi:alkylated DNA repair dioxygenase AlkB